MVLRKPIGELLARYELEPNLRDVFVEGHLDEVVIRRFLRQSSITATGIFRIESIDVRDELLVADERGSQRGRLMGLARHLAEETDGQAPARCIVDRDFEALLGACEPRASRLLLKTDWSTIEMYFFDAGLFDLVLSDYYRVASLDAVMLIQSIAGVLKTASIMFAANQSLGLGCRHLSLAKCCKYSKDSGLRFDHEDYMTRYLHTGATMARRDEFMSEIDRLLSVAPSEVRLWARGHDLLELLTIVLRKQGVKPNLCAPEAIERAFTLSADHGYLKQFALFEGLLGWHSEDE